MIEKDVLNPNVRVDKVKFKQLRERCNLTQKGLASKACVGNKVVEKAENDQRVKKDGLASIAAVFGVPVDELIQSDDERVVFTQAMLEAIPLPVFFKDREGMYRGCNDRFCKYIGRDRKHIVGKSVFEVAPKGLAEVYKLKDDELFANPGEQIYEATVMADQERRRVKFYKGTFPVNCTPEGIIGAIVDVTDYIDWDDVVP